MNTRSSHSSHELMSSLNYMYPDTIDKECTVAMSEFVRTIDLPKSEQDAISRYRKVKIIRVPAH